MSDAPYLVPRALSASASHNGGHVIVELATNGDDLRLAIPAPEVAPLVALLVQAAGQAQGASGSAARQLPLETTDTDVQRDEHHVDIHFRLTGGLDLVMGLTPVGAARLREQLGVSLAGTTSSVPTRQ
jgi:hypothetical protein